MKKIYHSTIKHWPQEDRPREKLLSQGEHRLSNSELLAILLQTGTSGENVLDLSRKVFDRFPSFRAMSCADLSAWKGLRGLGAAKFSRIKAALEIGRRFREERLNQKQQMIESSGDAVKILMPRMRDLKKEVVKILFLDSQNRILKIEEVNEGTVDFCQPIVREIYEKALRLFAVSLICIHNHPSGHPSPSLEDKEFTKKLYEAGQILQIQVLDHIIIGDDCYYSFADEGVIG
jgi:DNA repair protein RadC